MPTPSHKQSFQNEATHRFYRFFRDKIDQGEISVSELAETFKRSTGNPSQFLTKLKSGNTSVTIKDIEIARDKFRLSPGSLFGENVHELTPMVVSEPPFEYGKSTNDIGNKLREIFRKHKTEIKSYAEVKLKMTESQLYKILRNELRPYFDTIQQICKDHGESLDQFREEPLAQGHVLTQLKLLEQLVEEKDKRIAALEQQLKEKSP